jgi:hypothetical protein
VQLAVTLGVPVVAPRLGYIPTNLAGADRLLYDSDDPCGLATAIQRAADADLGDLCRRMQALHEETGDGWGRAAGSTRSVYERLFAGRQSAASETGTPPSWA